MSENKSKDFFKKSIQNISKTNNSVDFSKEQIIIKRLEKVLGKSREEVRRMISNDLLSVLTIVPFSSK